MHVVFVVNGPCAGVQWQCPNVSTVHWDLYVEDITNVTFMAPWNRVQRTMPQVIPVPFMLYANNHQAVVRKVIMSNTKR